MLKQLFVGFDYHIENDLKGSNCTFETSADEVNDALLY